MSSEMAKGKEKANTFAGLNSSEIRKAWGEQGPALAMEGAVNEVLKSIVKDVSELKRRVNDQHESQPETKPEEASVEEERYDHLGRVRLSDSEAENYPTGQIFHIWDRQEGTETELREMQPGKHTGNGIIRWGATKLDFWWIYRFPGVSLITIASTSQIAATLKHIGEYDPEDEKIKWAEDEDDPVLIEPMSMVERVAGFERYVNLGVNGEPVAEYKRREKKRNKKKKLKAKAKAKATSAAAAATEAEAEVNQQLEDRSQQTSSVGDAYTPSPESPFHPSKKMGRWPLIPFSAKAVPQLVDRIPEDELPRTLIVHDPWNLLEATGKIDPSDVETPWMKKQDVIRKYKLQRTSTSKEEPSSSTDNDDSSEDNYEYRFIMRGDLLELGRLNQSKPILAKCPPKPTRENVPSEAHLYLSPAYALGEGNHSFVYRAELEVPRAMFVEPQLCDRCLEEAVAEYCAIHFKDIDIDFMFVERQTRYEKRGEETGEDKPFSEPDFPEDMFYQRVRLLDQMDRHNHAQSVNCDSDDEPINDEGSPFELQELAKAQISGEPVRNANGDVAHKRSVGHNFLRFANRKYSGRLSIRHRLSKHGVVMAGLPGHPLGQPTTGDYQPDDRSEDEPTIRLRQPRMEHIVDYEGAVHELDLTDHPKVRWQSPDLTGPYFCNHLSDRFAMTRPCVPQTTRVTVAAKLSIKHDKHLEREARNYTRFPSHFFEDWTGYNFLDHNIGPTPVHAVVPRFYGYYLPEQEEKEKEKYYLSPIMLIEDCGMPIDPKELSQEQRSECFSLLKRFHIAGWRHGSVATRNIVRKEGMPHETPLDLLAGAGTPYFRLIDFGRSFRADDPEQDGDYEQNQEFDFKILLGFDRTTTFH